MAEEQRAPARSTGPDPLIGRVFNDRFRVVSLIARGGMGKVYRAEQAPLGREIALKVLNPNYSGEHDPEFHKRFFLEASISSKLRHPNTVTIFDYGRTDDDIYYIAMELLEGRTLHRALRQDGPFPAARAMHIARQICRSLREAHGLGVIHRDLKPANIFLLRHGDENDYVKVLDFGLVKELGEGEDLTQTGLFMGSPKYMAPEQIRGEDVDARADVYALGVILYEMLTGKVPFDRESSINILMAHVHEAPPPLWQTNDAADASPALEQVVMRALAKQPADRFASMDAMLEALKFAGTEMGHSMTRSLELGLTGEHSFPVEAEPVITASAPQPSPTVSGEATTSTTAPPQPSQTGRRVLIGTLVAALLAGAVTLAALLTRDEPSPPAHVEPAPSLPAASPTPTAPTAPDSVEAPLETLKVELRSNPAGAMVRIGEQLYGPTPADLEWVGEDAARGRQVTFVFELPGYRDYSITRVLASDRLEVSADLEPTELPKRAVRPRPIRPRPAPRTDEPPARRVSGFKMDPY